MTYAAQAEDEKIKIEYDNFKGWTDKETNSYILMFWGNTKIYYNNISISADTILGWRNQDQSIQKLENQKSLQKLEDIYAEGNVKINERDKEIVCDSIFLNIKTERGIIRNFRFKTINKKQKIPVIIKAEEAEKVAPNHYILKKGYITTCTYTQPHYAVNFHKAELFLGSSNVDDKIQIDSAQGKMQGLFPEIYGIPFFYLPLMPFSSESESLFHSIRLGKSKRFGYYDETVWGMDVKEDFLKKIGVVKDTNKDSGTKKWGELTLEQYYRSSRGFAGAIDLNYSGNNYEGNLYSYYMNDKGPNPNLDFDKQFLPLEKENRDWIKFFHRHNITDDVRLELELSYLSDRNLLHEFFPDEFKEGKEQETALYLRWLLKDNLTFSYLERHRLNDFQTQNEYLPKTRLDFISEPITNTPIGNIYFSSFTDITNIRKMYDDDLDLSSQHIWRFDNQSDLSISHDFGAFQATPFITNRLTVFEDTLKDDTETRLVEGYGIRLNSEAKCVYDVDIESFNLHKLRHITNLEMKFTNNFYTNLHKNELLQFDYVDEIDNFSELAFEFRNRFQTKVKKGEKTEVVEFLDISAGIEYYPKYKRDTTTLRNVNFLPPFNYISIMPDKYGIYEDRKFSDIYTTLQFSPTQYFDFRVFDEYNPSERTEETRSITLGIKPAEKIKMDISQNFVKDITNTYSAKLSLNPVDIWTLKFAYDYDFKNNRTVKEGISIIREFHDFFLSISLENDPSKDDKSIWFNIIPKFTGKQCK